jgi:hypothetical protein
MTATHMDHDRADPDHVDTQAQIGEWQPIHYRFKSLPVHVALLHTGKVLAFGGSGNDQERLKQPWPAEVWDPQTGEVHHIDQELAGDIFCAGHSFLPDGRLLVAGGTQGYNIKRFGFIPLPPFRGLEQTYLFDPVSETWTRVQDMSTGRWYPSLILLGDGRVLCMAGLTGSFPWGFLRTIEVYSPGQGWHTLDGAERWLPLYPRLHLLPNGDIFYAGSYNTHYTFPFRLSGFPTGTLNLKTRKWTHIGLPRASEREEGVTVLLPLTPPEYQAKVLLAGGGTPQGEDVVADAEVIDLSAPESGPHWRGITPMKHARYYAYAVILPNRQILILGGRSGSKHHHTTMTNQATEHAMEDQERGEKNPPQDPLAIHEAEIFDPDTETWSPVAAMQIDRLYHSNALLLPDGRVMVCGSNPASKVNELRIETYSPPYLFKSPRPQIEHAPLEVSYGEEFDVKTLQAGAIEEVALIRPSSTTHCLDTDQRYVGLNIIERDSETVRVKLPDNPNLAPPGYYMLFIVSQGIPSIAEFVQVH